MVRKARRNPRPRPHNYVAAVERFVAENPPPPGVLSRVEVLHDDWCGIHVGFRCNCRPIVRYAIDQEGS